MIWAHPDDKTYLAGGLSATLTDAGTRVVCVTATRGEAGGDGNVRIRELEVLLCLGGDVLDRKVEALLQQASQTDGLVAAVGLARFRAWVAREAFAAPQPTR